MNEEFSVETYALYCYRIPTLFLTINIFGKSHTLKLEFEPYQSILITIDKTGRIGFEDILFIPKVPVKDAAKN